MLHHSFFIAPFFALPFVFAGLAMLLGAALFVFWLWMLVEAAGKEPDAGSEKIMWVLVIIFTHWIGALIYYFVRRPERIRICGK